MLCSNPLAGTDTTLLALSGSGYMGGKLFGFASCERAVGAAEGMNVLAERRVPSPRSQGLYTPPPTTTTTKPNTHTQTLVQSEVQNIDL